MFPATALKVEPGTPLWESKDCVNIPDGDTQADMYLYTCDKLDELGFHQYEISNFSRLGFASRHNLKYWTGGEYLGFGPSAASDFAGKRFTIARDITAYCDGILTGGAILSECEEIPSRERAGEYLMLRLRTRYRALIQKNMSAASCCRSARWTRSCKNARKWPLPSRRTPVGT